MHYFEYKKTKTEDDFKRCLINAFKCFGRKTKKVLIDNMAAILNVNESGEKKVHETVVQFFKDIGVELKLCKVRTPQTRRLKHFTSYSVLIIDEVCFLPISQDEANLFFQLINMQYEKHPIIITTNKCFNKLGEVFGNHVIGNAILDRLLHH